MFVERFGLPVVTTRHAWQRMLERDIDEMLLMDLIETGTLRHKDDAHLWLFKH